jgi:AcrR family transcriptional regulator
MATSPSTAAASAPAPSEGAAVDTKQRILDAAEYLFAEQGVGSTSLRAIIAAAGVNSAAIHYHFGSKEALIEAVFARRITPINEARLAALDSLERRGALDHAGLLRAFLEPMVGVHAPRGGAGERARGALGRLLMEEPQSFRSLAEAHVSEVKQRFAEALARLSEIEVDEATERIEFAMGAMLHGFARRALTNHESPNLDDVHRRMQHMIRFLAAGFAVGADPSSRAPTTRLSS